MTRARSLRLRCDREQRGGCGQITFHKTAFLHAQTSRPTLVSPIGAFSKSAVGLTLTEADKKLGR
jgi:hypothetical protein